MNFVKAMFISLLVFTLELVYGDGLPGEYLLSDKWRQVFSNQSPVDNPAFIMEEPYLKIRGVLSVSSGDPARLWEIGGILPVNILSSVGLSILGESGNDVSGVVLSGTDFVDAGVKRNSNLLFMGSYAISPINNISLGTNFNLVYQGNFGEAKWGYGADIGVTYSFTFRPEIGSHIVGFSFKNLFSPKVSNSDKMPYSSQFKTQYHVSIMQNRFFMDCELSMSDFNSRSALFSSKRKFDWDTELQFGVTPIQFVKILAFAGINQWNDLGSFGLVFGVDMPNLNNGKELSFLYQYRQNMHADLLGGHSLYGTAQVGSHREQVYARRLTQMGRYALNNLYSQAMKNYHEKNYWDAYFAFSRLLFDYPAFFKNDAAAFFAASCLENLDMRSAAVQAYQIVKHRYPQSPYAAQAELGILRIRYREGNYDEVRILYRRISEGSVSDSVKEHAAYYMGETEVILGNYNQAVSYFQLVNEESPLYSFSQHSLATAHVFLNTGKERIKNHLMNVIDVAKGSTAAQKEIVNRSLILLGYIYYEEKSMAKAVTALRMIPKDSYYYEDAQLGLGWAAIKSKQWGDCIDAGKNIFEASKKEIIQSESQLLQAYGYLQQKNYSEAEKFLKKASSIIEIYNTVEADYANKQIRLLDSTRVEYDSLANHIIKMAKQSYYQLSEKDVDELHKKQMSFKSNIDSSIRNMDEYKRTRFFEKAFLKLKEDLEYALVTVLRIRSSSENENINEKKDEHIDNQIDELKSKMKDMKKVK